jgi:hypothetical protein
MLFDEYQSAGPLSAVKRGRSPCIIVLPAGSQLRIVSEVRHNGLVDAMWNDLRVTLFLEDLNSDRVHSLRAQFDAGRKVVADQKNAGKYARK